MNPNNNIISSIDNILDYRSLQYEMKYLAQKNKRFEIEDKNGDYISIESPDTDELSSIKTKIGEHNIEFKYGNYWESDIVNYKKDIVSYNQLLWQYKTVSSYNVEHSMPGIIRSSSNKILELTLGKANISLAVPEDVTAISLNTNSAYIFYNDSEDGKSDKVYLEVHGSKTSNIAVIIDYSSSSSYVIKNGEIITNCLFEEKDPEHLTFGQFHLDDLKYVYIDGVVSDVYKQKGHDNTRTFSYRADICDEDGEIEKIIGIIPVPYIITFDDIITFDSDHKLYKTYIIEKDEEGNDYICNFYSDFSAEEAANINNFWAKLVTEGETEID